MSIYEDETRSRIFYDKYWGRQLDDEAFFKAIKTFVQLIPNHEKRATVVREIIRDLNEIGDAVKLTTWRFWGSSIFLVIDSETHKVDVRLIDFGSCDLNEHGVLGSDYDKGFVDGLENLKRAFLDTVP